MSQNGKKKLWAIGTPFRNVRTGGVTFSGAFLVYISGAVQTALYVDFFYYYAIRCVCRLECRAWLARAD